MSEVVYISNDHDIEIIGLQDRSAGTYLNSKTVTATLKTEAGVTVTGMTFPLTLDYVAASNGNYRGVLDKDIVVVVGTRYLCEITVAGSSGERAFWQLIVEVEQRREGR